MSFRSLTHYFVHMALAGEHDDAPEPPEPSAWEKNMQRSSDQNKLLRIGEAIVELQEQLELGALELHCQAGRESLGKIDNLLQQARVACWKL
jgi:hypothetical protein